MRGITYSEHLKKQKKSAKGKMVPKNWKWWLIDQVTGKHAYAAYFGFATYFLHSDILYSTLLAASLSWAVTEGWGKGFLAVHGDRDRDVYDDPDEYKWWVDKPTIWLHGEAETVREKRTFGAVWMTVQCMYKFAPMVAVTAWSLNNLWLLLSLPVLAASFGASYWLVGLKYTPRSIMWAELLSGFILANYLVWL